MIAWFRRLAASLQWRQALLEMMPLLKTASYCLLIECECTRQTGHQKLEHHRPGNLNIFSAVYENGHVDLGAFGVEKDRAALEEWEVATWQGFVIERSGVSQIFCVGQAWHLAVNKSLVETFSCTEVSHVSDSWKTDLYFAVASAYSTFSGNELQFWGLRLVAREIAS